MKQIYTRLLFALMITGLFGGSVFAGEWCTERSGGWDSKRESAFELRQVTIGNPGTLKVDGRQNGGIRVIGEDRGDVLVEACIRAWASSKVEALNVVQTTQIETNGIIRATNFSEKSNSSVSFKIRVPRNMDLGLTAKNGGLKVVGVNGSMELRTVNGGISLTDVAGDVKGRTTNGGVKVGLGGSGWTGGGLDVETVNGGVKIYIPSNFAADVEAGTVNGGFKSDFPELRPPERKSKYNWNRNKRVRASINGGGASIRAVTTNGGIKIQRAN